MIGGVIGGILELICQTVKVRKHWSTVYHPAKSNLLPQGYWISIKVEATVIFSGDLIWHAFIL